MTSLNLSAHQWHDRLLLIFTPSREYDAYVVQMQLLEDQTLGLDDRNLRLIQIFADGGTAADAHLDEAAAMQLRDRFDVDQSTFQVVLVGKDGTEKRRYATAVNPQTIFAAIDAMPMRQKETQGGRSGA
jgi:hypothetical protein